MTYGEWICANTKLRGRPFSFEGYEFQEAIVNDMSPDLAVKKPSQIGMALALSTPIPTPTGWTTMGEIQVGDIVFDEVGAQCIVECVSPVYIDHVCYKLTFDNGHSIIADANHRWFVHSHHAFKGDAFYTGAGRPPSGSGFAHEGVVTTQFMAEHFKVGGRNRFSIPTTGALQTPITDLPVDPYFLGAWLGDGNTHASVITGHVDDIQALVPLLEMRGMECRFSSLKANAIQIQVSIPGTVRKQPQQVTNHPGKEFDTLARRLSLLGLLEQKKFVPDIYLRAEASVRLDVLRGLLDTDGSITKAGRVSFSNTNSDLIAGFEELAVSLGFKTHTRWRSPGKMTTLKNGQTICSKLFCGEVSFTAYAQDAVFLMPRKASRLKTTGRKSETSSRRVVNVERVETTPVRCISVNSPNHLFLAGRGMIPTHNTEVQIRKFLAFLARNRGTSGIFTFPSEKMFKTNSKTRIKPVVSQPAFGSTGLDDERPNRSMNLYEINGSFAHIMGMTEGEATSTPADILAHDEVDLSDQVNIGLFQSRLQNSVFKITQKFSTPTHPGFGIDAAFIASDARHYFVKCECCGHQQVPNFTMPFLYLPGYNGDGDMDKIDADMVSRIDMGGCYVKCERCSKALNLRDPTLREWVPMRPTREAHGYQILPFSTYKLPPAYIIRQLQKMRQANNLKGWYNTVLGETFSDGASKLEPDAVKAVMKGPGRPEIDPRTPMALASDMGLTCHLVMGPISGDMAHPILFEQVSSNRIEDRIKELRAQYNIVCGGVDRHPYTPTAEAIRDASNRIILPIEYRGTPFINLKNDEYDNLDYVQINRTAAIDTVVRAIQGKSLTLAGYGGLEQIVIEHLCDMVRIETDEKPATWEKLTGNDHFMHAVVLLQASVRIAMVVQASKPAPTHLHFGLVGIEVPTHEQILHVTGTRNNHFGTHASRPSSQSNAERLM